MGRGKRRAGATLSAPRAAVPGTGSPDVLLSQAEHRAIAVTPGVLDERAIAAFGRGQCHALALALHDETGWPLRVLEDEEADAVHVFVITPEGKALDAGGCLGLEEFREVWMAEYLEDYSRERVAQMHHWGGWREPDLETARTFVPAVLALQGSDQDYIHVDELTVSDVQEPVMTVVGEQAAHRVVAGQWDAAAAAAFADGQSHALAMALCLSVPDSTMACLRDEQGEIEAVFMSLPDGRLVDARGLHTPAEIDPDGKLEPVRFRELRELGELDEWPEPDVAAAEAVSSALLKSLSLR
jgi:hypothetical protein